MRATNTLFSYELPDGRIAQVIETVDTGSLSRPASVLSISATISQPVDEDQNLQIEEEFPLWERP